MSDATSHRAAIPEWPGLHPGTGTNDHIHHWQQYAVNGRTIRACQVCGAPHPDDATLEAQR